MDESLLRAVNSAANSDPVATLGVALSSPWLMAIVFPPLLLVLLHRRRFGVIVSAALAMGASDAISAGLMKPVFDRPRPCHQLEGLRTPAGCGPGMSLPSAHASNAFALLTSVAPSLRLGWAVMAPLCASVAGSRVLIGVHYPSDIAAGALFGGILGLGFGWLGRRAEEWLALRLGGSQPPSG